MSDFKRGENPKVSLNIGLSSDIIKLCKGVLNANPEHYNNPNGPDETTCPFCGKTEKWWGTMKEISHLPDCAYLLAKEILDRINK